MNKFVTRTVQYLVVVLLASFLLIPQGAAFAQPPSHVVSSAELQRDVSSASVVRQQNVNQVENFLSTPGARQALESANMNYQQVKDAVPQLSNQELARIANMSRNAQKDFAAGYISDRNLMWLILIAAAIILIAVLAS